MSRRAFWTTAVTTLLAAGGAAAGTAIAGGEPSPRRRAAEGELRGMWLATVSNRDWPSAPGLTADAQRAELLTHLDTAVARRLNAVIFQVRPTADALWPSPHEPWSQYLTGTQGKDPGWDPLGTAVEEAHARGLELHAWFNPYRIALHADPGRLVASHPARKNPGWAVPYGGKLYYNPGIPAVRAFVRKAMLDAVRKYPVDAVHFDDYFYPYPVAGQVFDDDAAYDRYGASFPNRAAWRRDNVDRLVRETAAEIKVIRPGAQFGISPFGVWRNAETDERGSATRAGVQTYDDLYADTRKWVRENWIDYIVPQLYWNIGFEAADYAELLPWWAETARGSGTRLYIGEALYKAGDPAQPAAWQEPAELSEHLTLARDVPEARGHVFFSAKDVEDDRIGAMARVVADHYQRPAEPPR
ncbi:glycoside hydrolase family 10 protein [Streptomyces europaeiscabiei]|uniref:Family 10 glycosylhydrolase n=1 Tax=Streptomyces europaeiscabiei TaxID=146819 RepID=A0ABU4NPY2_9ACTN|nr:family 10 glycosylhydrolase [Streptomyces europaeiscabiei]MDX2758996.1 family 10 glycosylhydrolase [Streptomyces europaeiscabiei]MDX2768664.1 family 10 glycosylhydrolase [Streptomyces europaeiscabiei]MDX3546876.1 family 10 glycosylhydrolase [Streptomyces europaeiscabiei]MDX3556570.1 family 10 glycosylhydrolase [Streptomyces europaeiscabiei]MDX3668729.1 family 10 glycosylhydrolase [Streptomyces europaeiscabiei]